MATAFALGAFAIPARAANPVNPIVSAADPVNPIVAENQQTGSWNWQLSGPLGDDGTGQIKGYASATSVQQGQSITFRVSVNPAQQYTIDFFRIGWYAGRGGRLRLHVGPLAGVQQPPCPVNATTGLIECSWAASYTLSVPNDWTSGIYLALLTNAGGYQNHVPFVVRDGRPADFLYQQGITTDQAYNNWPDDHATGKSLYSFNSNGANTVSGNAAAVKVSFDRPYSFGGAGQFFNFELDLVRWLEQNGYDVTYSTDVDTHESGGALRNYKGFISAGHDEYWTKQMRDAVEAARDSGVNLAFMGADAAEWQARLESSSGGVADRVLVCYRYPGIDPVQGPTTTVEWRNPLINRPEQTLIGIQFTSAVNQGNEVPYVVNNSSHWIYAGTGFKDGDTVPGIVGYEMDRYWPDYPAPPGTNRTLLSHSPYVIPPPSNQPDYANSSIYQAPSGAWVFASGTMSWSRGLGDFHNLTDARIQRTTANLLSAFTSGAPVVDHLRLSAAATVTAGQPFNVTVTAENSLGTPVTSYSGTVHFTSSDTSSGVVLPADTTLTSGTGTFPVTLIKAGAQTVTATDKATASITGQVSVNVGGSGAASFTITGPTNVLTGQAFNITVTAKDAQGNPDPAYGGTVHFTSTDAAQGVVLPADTTLTNGQGTFSVTLISIGAQMITVNCTTSPQMTGTLSVSVGASTPVSLSVSTPASATAGQPFSMTVTAQDAQGNPDPSYAGTVHFASNDASPGVVLPADTTLTSGTGTFSATLIKAGSATVTASDAANSLSATAALGVTAQSATHLGLSTAGTLVAGAAFSFTASALDQFGNTDTGYAGTVHFTSSDSSSGVVLPADATLANGQGTFSATLIRAGSQTLTGTDTASSSISGTLTSTVRAASATQLVLSTGAGTVTAGTSFSFSVTALDPFGNTDTGYAGRVHFKSSDTLPGVVLPADATLTNGTRTFSATLVKAGSQSVTATDTANSSITASLSVTIRAASATKLKLSTGTGNPTAGVSFSFNVTAQDPYGNTDTAYSGTVHFTSSDTWAGVVLPADSTLSNGQGTFAATLVRAGTQTVTGSAGSVTGTLSVSVRAGNATRFNLTGTSTTTAGVSFSFNVTALDQFGNTDAAYAGTVHFTSSDTWPGVVLPGDSTLSSGQRAFNATLVKAGSQAITATAGGVTGTLTLTVRAAAAASLNLTGVPSAVTLGTPFNVTVTLKDSFGNVATGYTGTVHFTSTDPLATLPVDYTFSSANAGVKTFSVTLATPTVLPLLQKQTITAADTVNSSLRATSAPITVNPL